MTSFNRKSAILFAALGAVLLIGLAGCGGDEPAPPPPAPPPFVPQTITVTLGEHGGTAQFQTTQAGGFTQGGNAFASGSTIVSEDNGKTYRVTLSGNAGTAEFVAADQVRLRLGSSGEGLFIDENEDGTYTGTLAVNFEETTFSSGELVRTSRGVQYRLTLEEGTWTAAFEAPPPVEITLGASGFPVELIMTEDGGYTLNGNQFRSGDIVTTPTDSRYRLTLVNGEWQYTYVPPDPIRVSLGTSGDVALLMRRENGSYEIGGTVITSGDIIQADNGNSYRIRFQGGRWTAAFVPAPPVSVTLGTSGLQISLARQEDGSYRHGNDVIQSGGTITAANGSEYRLTLANGVWRATYVLPRGIPVLLGISGELANVVRLEDGTYQVNGQPLGPDSTVTASNGNMYRITRMNGTWSAIFVAPDPVRVMLGTSGQSVVVTRREDGTWLGNGDPITSGATVTGPGGTRYQMVLQNSVWVAVWLPTAPVAVVLGTSGDAVVITQVEDGTYRANGDPVASGSVLTATNGTRYRVTFANGSWTATFVAGDPISVQLGTSGTTAVLIRAEDGGFTWNGERIAPGATLRALNGSEYRLTQVNGQWTATYAPPPPVNVVLGTSGEILTLARRENGQWVNPAGTVVRTGSTIRSGAGNQYRLTFADGSWAAEFQPTSQRLTLGTTGGQVSVVREENGQYYIGGTAIRTGDTYTAENGNQFRVYLINGEWRAEFVPTVVRVPAGDTNLIVILQRLESGSFLYNGEEFEVGDTITYRGSQYRINITNGIVTLDSESGAIQVPLGNTGDSFTLIRVSDGTFQYEDGRPFRSGTRIVQNGFWWQLTLEDGQWSARILGAFDPANPGGPVDPRDPTQPPVDPTTPAGTDKIGFSIPGTRTGVFGLKASSSATSIGTTGSILAVGPTGSEVEYSINDLLGRGTVTKRLTFVQNAQQELRAIINTINLYNDLYREEGVDPNVHIAGASTGQWALAKAALEKVRPTFGNRLNAEPWSGTLEFSEVPAVIAELEEVIAELDSASEIDAHYTTGSLTGSDIIDSAISQIQFGSSGNTRYAAFSRRGAADTVDTDPATWTTGAFAYTPLERPASTEVPDRGSATYRGTTVAVAGAGDTAGEGTLYSGTIELNAHFSQQRVNALITGLQDSDGTTWRHGDPLKVTQLIRLPEARFSGNQGGFSGTGDGFVRYPAQVGGEASEASSSLDGQVLSDGREVLGTWALGTWLRGAFGVPRTGTGTTTRPTINDRGDGVEAQLSSHSAIDAAASPAPNSSGDITFDSGDDAIGVDASSLYSSGSYSKSEPTFVSEARSALSSQQSVLRGQRTTLDGTVIGDAWDAVEAAVTTIFGSVPSALSISDPTDADGINAAIDLIVDARAALGGTSRFIQELGTDTGDVFNGAITPLPTTARATEIFAARPSVFRVESARTNFTRFGAWRNHKMANAVATPNPPVPTTGVYAYSPLAQTDLTTAPGFLATYEGQTLAVRSSDGNLYEGQFQLLVDWRTATNVVTAIVQDLRDSSNNSWFQYSDQDVSLIRFSGLTVASPFAETTSGTVVAEIQYRNRFSPIANPASPSLRGVFVGSGDDGPFGVIGDWSISLPGTTTDTLTGAFGADLLP